ncbi:MAG: hypothetical protein NTY74_05770 [Ignavibacteriae bacterium]|nr:hypothetical protein [Ignavibacteriota bacterium]
MNNRELEIKVSETKSEYHRKQALLKVEEKFLNLIELQKLHISFAQQRGEKLEEWKKVFRAVTR